MVVSDETHYYGFYSTTGFVSQNSRWITVSLGTKETALVTVDWPSGLRSEHTISYGARVWLHEPPPILAELSP